MAIHTPNQFVAWCRANPTDNLIPGATWDQKCGSLVYRAGNLPMSASSAYYAALATAAAGHPLNVSLDYESIPFGWFVYFDKAGPTNGHVGMSMGDGTFLSGNWRASNFGLGLGTMSIAYYASLSDRYMGASPYYINSTLAGVSSSTAGTGATPLENDMYDGNAQATLIAEIQQTRYLKLYAWGTGLIAVNPNGREWVLPNSDYGTLLAHLGLAPSQAVAINDQQHTFLIGLLRNILPANDAPSDAAVQSIVSLTPAAVSDLVSKISAAQVVLTEAQVRSLASDVAAALPTTVALGADVAARVTAAIKGATIVSTIQ